MDDDNPQLLCPTRDALDNEKNWAEIHLALEFRHDLGGDDAWRDDATGVFGGVHPEKWGENEKIFH